MSDFSNFSHFTLSAYMDLGWFRYLVFLLLLALYVLTLSANLLLIMTITLNRTLTEPMYLFLCSLFVSEVYGCTLLIPMLLHHVLWDLRQISRAFCLLQIYCVHSYGTTEFLNLAVLAYDRYVAICFPLQYHAHLKKSRVIKLAAFPWAYGLLSVVVTLCTTTSLQLCDNVIDKVYCDNYSVVRMACSDVSLINIYGLFISLLTLAVPCAFMLYSYLCILRVCCSGSKQNGLRALGTCVPHLITLLNFSMGGSFELVQSRFDMSNVSMALRVFLSLYCLGSQPLLSPLLYGLNITKLRTLCKGLLLARLRKV